MSLTSHLDDKGSLVQRHVEFVAASVVSAVRGSPFGEPLVKVLGLDSLPKGSVVAPVPGANAGTVGSAFDYRLRYHLAPCRSRDFVAYHASRFAPDSEAIERLDRFFSELDLLAKRLTPAGRHLGDDDERLLDRYCIVLALLEAAYRRGPQYYPDTSLDGLLDLAAEPAILDLVNLSRSAETYFRPLIELVTSDAVRYHPNPVFAGSRDVGGADADMIVGDAIIELKVTRNPTPAAVRQALVQLVGYTLLDYDDDYEIRKLAVYLPRQQWMRTWPLWTVVFPLPFVVHSKEEPSEAAVRERLAQLRAMMRRAAAGQEIDYTAELGE